MSKDWDLVPLGEILKAIDRPEVPIVGKIYRQIGVKLWGGGAYERESIDGSQTQYKTLSKTEANDIIVNKIWARHGSVTVISSQLAGCYVSNEFPLFKGIPDKLNPLWFYWFTKIPLCWQQCDNKSQGSSGKNRIRPEKFLEIEIPLPPLEEQRRIVARIEELASKIQEARSLRNQTIKDLNILLVSVYKKIIKDAQYLPMSKVAPLKRRPVKINFSDFYPELGIRSFGKGTFHKPALQGLEVGTKKLFKIEANDLLFQIVFAWEGAVAVAKPEDDGRFGSHRFLTCLPQKGITTSSFLCFHFLTQKGLEDLGQASPGGAGRNRTLGLQALAQIQVPIPSYEKQLYFDKLQSKIDEMKRLREESLKELDALLPSILDKAFKGELQ